ncbi:MAG: carboxypeptidase regulatory-like domain-containing protein, partial [Planctomycetota bacterium]
MPKLGRDAEAIAVYEQLLEAKPTFLMVVQNNLADLLATTEQEDLRDPPRAIRLTQEAIGASPRFAAQLYDTLAKAHAAAGDLQAAVEAQEKAVEAAFAPQRAELQTRLSEYRERAGRAPVDSGTKPTAAGDGLVEGEYARTTGRMLWRVLDPDGKPMAGASVRSNLGGKDGVAAKKDIVNATQTTDERGEVVIELPELVDLARIWTRAAGHPPLFTQWWPSQEPDGYPLPEEFTVRMVAGRTAGGVVVNEAGEPIVGARVAVKRESGGEDPAESGRPQLGTWLAYGSAAAITDDDGQWSIANVPPGDDVELSLMLSHPDYVDDGAWGETQQAEKVSTSAMLAGAAKLVMRRGVELTGRVLDPDGQPVENAIVIWGDDPYFDQGENEVLTDAEGVYRLPLLSEAQRRVTVVAEGWAPRSEVIDFAAIDGPVDFPLQPGGEIRLRVQNQAGEPVSNAGVWLSQNAWRGVSVLHHQSGNSTIKQPIPRTADQDGVYVWDWAPEDAVTVRVGRKGFASRTVTLAAGDDQVVTLRPERVARGMIVDAVTGEPVLGCSVFTVVELGGGLVVERFDAKKVDGEFSIRLDRDDAPQGVHLEALGYRTKRLGPWALDEAIPELRVKLEPAEPIEARVLGVDGQPVVGTRVRIATPTILLDNPAEIREFERSGVAVTDDAGRF